MFNLELFSVKKLPVFVYDLLNCLFITSCQPHSEIRQRSRKLVFSFLLFRLSKYWIIFLAKKKKRIMGSFRRVNCFPS